LHGRTNTPGHVETVAAQYACPAGDDGPQDARRFGNQRPAQLWGLFVNKRLLIGLAKYGVGFALLGYLMWRNWAPAPDGSSPGLGNILSQPPQLGPLALASILCLASILLTFLRWYVLVRAQALPFTIYNALRLGLIGYFLSTFLPGSVGGDIFKAAFLAREQERRTVAVATVIIDRVIGLWALFWLVALVGSAFWLLADPALFQHPLLQAVVGTTVAVVVGTSLFCGLMLLLPEGFSTGLVSRLVRIPRIGGSAAEFWRAMWMYRNQWRSVLVALLLSLVGHLGFVLTYYFAAQMFLASSQLPSLKEQLLLVPIGMTAQAAVPLPGGLGGGEAAFNGLFDYVGFPDTGFVASMSYRLISWGLGFLGYLVYLRMRAEVAVIQQATDDTEPLPAADEAESSGPAPTAAVPVAAASLAIDS